MIVQLIVSPTYVLRLQVSKRAMDQSSCCVEHFACVVALPARMLRLSVISDWSKM